MSEIKNLLNILLVGSPEDCRIAKKELSKLWHSKKGRILFEKSAETVFEYMKKFEDIKTPKNKETFIAGLDLFYLVLGDDHFDRLKEFTLKTVQHPHGHIRKAVVQTSDWLFVSLSSRIKPFIYPAGKKLSTEQKVEQVVARNQYKIFLEEVEELLFKYRLKENERVKYIESMKPSVEKSLQMLWSRLTDISRHSIEHPRWVMDKRKEIKQKLLSVIKQYSVDLDIRDVEDAIFDENNYQDIALLLKKFKNVKTLDELNTVTQIFNDAWNYFPHRSLTGLSPAEKKLGGLN